MSARSGRAWVSRVIPTTPLRLLAWMLVLGVLAGAAYVGWLWRHPTAFPEVGGWGMTDRAAEPGTPLWVGMSYENDGVAGTMTIRDVQPHVVRDSAAAEIEFFVCTIDPSAGIGAIGSVRGGGLRHDCASLVPAQGAEVGLNARPRQQVVMSVTTTRPGRVRIAGMDLSYSLGWQTGTQRTGGVIVVIGH